jgi:hypothetical protein
MSQNPLVRDPNNMPVQNTYRTVTGGTVTISTSGTPVKLTASSTSMKRVDVVAGVNNSGTVYVGGSNTLASSKTGLPITSLGSAPIYVNDLSSVYADSTSSGDTVSFVYYN